jgi:hypothetical protein
MLRPAPPVRLCASGARPARHAAAATAAPQDAGGARTARAAGASLSRRAASERDVVCDAERGAGGAGGNGGGSEPHAGSSRSGNGNGNGNGSSAGNGQPRDLGDAASAVGDDFWRDGGGFPHYLQSRVRFAPPRTRPAARTTTRNVRA